MGCPLACALPSVALVQICSFYRSYDAYSTQNYLCQGVDWRIMCIRGICHGKAMNGRAMLVQGCPRMEPLLLRWPSCSMNGTDPTAAWSSPAAAARPSCRPSSGLVLAHMRQAGLELAAAYRACAVLLCVGVCGAPCSHQGLGHHRASAAEELLLT